MSKNRAMTKKILSKPIFRSNSEQVSEKAYLGKDFSKYSWTFVTFCHELKSAFMQYELLP